MIEQNILNNFQVLKMVDMADIADMLGTNIPVLNITVLQLIIAILILVIGLAVVKIAIVILKSGLRKQKLPALVIEFLGRLVGALLNIVIILLFVGALGYNVDSIVLGLSAIIGLILAFGLSESFHNFFAGIWLATLRPIDKDEVVSVSGVTGKVSAVGMMATEFHTPDNKFITVPNKLVFGSPIENMTRMPTRRVDVDVGIAYGSSIENAIRVAMAIIQKHPLVLKDPAPSVVSTELADSSVNLQLRPWSKTEDYWTVKDDLTKGIHDAYLQAGIEIPFPQVDVHMKKE
jgi:small-conductance mechanosensitive channel